MMAERRKLLDFRSQLQMKKFVKQWGNMRAKIDSKQLQKADINLLGTSHLEKRSLI